MKFNIDKFSYKKIINAYKEKFNRFTFIKFEKIENMQALGKIFKLNDNDLQILKKSFKSSTVNRGLSKFAFKLTWRLISPHGGGQTITGKINRFPNSKFTQGAKNALIDTLKDEGLLLETQMGDPELEQHLIDLIY